MANGRARRPGRHMPRRWNWFEVRAGQVGIRRDRGTGRRLVRTLRTGTGTTAQDVVNATLRASVARGALPLHRKAMCVLHTAGRGTTLRDGPAYYSNRSRANMSADADKGARPG